MNKLKRISTLLLALVMTAMLAVSAYAATVVVKYRVYVYTSQLTFTQYDYSSSTTPSLTNLTVRADSSLGSGSALYHVKYVNGAVAYCIQPGVRSDDSSNYVQGSSGCWYNLPAAVQSGIALALSCGYPSAEYGVAYGDSNSGDIINAEKWAATQAVIWDLICEYRSPYDYRSWGTSPFYTCVDTSRYPTFDLWYDEIISAMQAATDIPSFAATSSRWCDTIELTKDASGNKVADVTTGADGGAVFSDLPLGNYSYQEISAPEDYVVDSTRYTVTISTAALHITEQRTNALAKGSLTIRKIDATGGPLAGAELLLETSTDGQSWAEVGKTATDSTGAAKWDDLKLGAKYRVTEVKAPAGYTLLPEPVSVDALTADAPDITVTLCNNAGFVLPFTGGRGFITPILFAALMLGMGVYFCKISEFKKENN